MLIANIFLEVFFEMNLTKSILLSATVLTTGQIANASDKLIYDLYWQKSGEFIDNIFAYAVDQYNYKETQYNYEEAQHNAPAGIKLANRKVNHPVFGEMYVISHKDDIDYYNSNITEDTTEVLVDNFLKYVVEISLWGIKQDELRDALLKMGSTKVGMNTLKVITSKYMQQHEKYKEFYYKNEAILEEYLNADKIIEEIHGDIDKANKSKINKSKELKLIDKQIKSEKLELPVCFFSNPMGENFDRDLSKNHSELYNKFKKYHKLQKQLSKISKSSTQDTAEKKQILEKIMAYDNYTRASYKIFKEILGTVHREVVEDIYKYAYWKREKLLCKQLKGKETFDKEYYKKAKRKIKRILNSYEDKEAFKEDTDKIIKKLENTYEDPEYNLEDYEKEYLVMKQRQVENESSNINKRINDLKLEEFSIRLSQQRSYNYLYPEFCKILKEHDRINTKAIDEFIIEKFEQDTLDRKFKDIARRLKLAFQCKQSEHSNDLSYFINKLHFEYEPLENNYTYGSYTNIITLGKEQKYTNYKISADKQIISSRENEDTYHSIIFDDTNDGTQLNAIQHEIIHFKDKMTSYLLGTKKTKIKNLGSSIKLTDTFKNNFKKISKNAENESIMKKNMTHILDRIYDNTVEMVCMYGILYHNGTFFFDPLDEALATAEKDMFHSTDSIGSIQTVRTGHTVSKGDLGILYKALDQATNIYSWYFNPKLRNLADL